MYKIPRGLPRLTVGAASLAFALLTVVEAPSWSLFVTALVATELGHFIAPAALALLVRPRYRSELAGAALGGAAALLLLSPTLRALNLARRLPGTLPQAFAGVEPRSLAGAPARRKPFAMRDLGGITSPAVQRDTLVYATHSEKELQLDIYRPIAQVTTAPCLLCFHGGSYRHGTRGDFPQIFQYLAARGYVVASAEYRMLPEYRFPSAQEDADAALRFLIEHAAEFGIDPTRIVLYGRSAGGQIALVAAYTATMPVRGVIALYPPTDFLSGYANPARLGIMDSRSICEEYLGGPPDTSPEQYNAASPVALVGPATPPTLLIHGGRDEVVHAVQSRMLAERLEQAGRQCVLLVLPWATHGMDSLLNTPGGQFSTYAVERFLAAVTG